MTEQEKERQTINKTFKGEMKKLKDMTFSEKAEYIWDYYKLQIFIILCALALIGSLTHHYLTRKTNVLFGVIVNAQCLKPETLDDDLMAFLNIGEKEEIRIENTLLLKASADLSAEGKLTCYIAARNLDFTLGDDDMMTHFGQNGFLQDLKTVLPTELYEYFKEDIITKEYTNPEEGTVYTQNFLRLNDYKFFEDYEFYLRKEGGDFFIAVVGYAPNPENIVKLFEYIQSLGK